MLNENRLSLKERSRRLAEIEKDPRYIVTLVFGKSEATAAEWMLALSKNGMLIKEWKPLTDIPPEFQIMACLQNPKALACIDSPCEDAKTAALVGDIGLKRAKESLAVVEGFLAKQKPQNAGFVGRLCAKPPSSAQRVL